MNKSKATGILVTYAGIPYTTSCFFLDNGMANLAGSLVKAGHQAFIMDYNTPEVLEYVLNIHSHKRIETIMQLLDTNEERKMLKANEEYAVVQEDMNRGLDKYNDKIILDISKQIRKMNADFVCFKLWLGRGLKASVYIGQKIKEEFPHIHIFAGGPAATLFTDQVIQHTDAFEIIALGEGEESIVELAEYSIGKKALNRINGIVYFENGNPLRTQKREMLDLNRIPEPIYYKEIYPDAHDKMKKIRVITTDESRGCKRKCAFCTHSLLGGPTIRCMQPERIIKEYRRGIEALGTRVFNFGGSCVPPGLIYEIAKLNLDNNLHIKFNGFVNANDVDVNHLDIMKKGGLFSVFYGLESLDKNILIHDYHKAPHIEKTKNVVKKTLEAGIYVTGSIIFPAPNETEESENNTIHSLMELFSGQPRGTVIPFYPGLMPGSEWSKHMEDFNIQCDDLDQHFADLMSCEIRHFLPTSLWQNYNYSMNHICQKDLAIKTNMFASKLQENNVSIGAMGDSAILANALKIDTNEFAGVLKKAFIYCDYETLYDMNSKINDAICQDQF